MKNKNKKKKSIIEHVNEIIEVKPSLFGVKLNINKIIDIIIKKRQDKQFVDLVPNRDVNFELEDSNDLMEDNDLTTKQELHKRFISWPKDYRVALARTWFLLSIWQKYKIIDFGIEVINEKIEEITYSLQVREEDLNERSYHDYDNYSFFNINDVVTTTIMKYSILIQKDKS